MSNLVQKLQKALDLQNSGQIEEAQKIYIDILQKDPNCCDAWNLYALLALSVGDNDSGVRFLENAVLISPSVIPYKINLSEAYKRKGELDKALRIIEEALKLDPQNVDALYNKATILKDVVMVDESKQLYQKVLSIDPNDTDALFNLANIYSMEGDLKKGVELYKKVYKLTPRDVKNLNNLAIASSSLGEFRDADTYYLKALEITPNDPFLHFNLGNNRRCQRNFEYAKKSFQRAITLKADEVDFTLNLSFVHLMLCEFRDGFRLYEIRFLKDDANIPVAPKKINTQTIPKDKKLFIHHEQGFGDTIMFSRFLSLLENEYVFLPQKNLFPFFETSDLNAVDVVPSEESYDISIPLLSMPYLLGIENISDIPCSPFKKVKNSERIERIGIFFSGNKEFKNAAKKAVPLKKIMEYIGDLGLEIYSFQIEDGESIKDYPDIIDLGSKIASFKDTLELIDRVDLVVSIDSAMAHLCGSVEKNCALLLHYDCDWRWGYMGEDSYWYGNMKLFRQEIPDMWDEPLNKLRTHIISKNGRD